MDFNLEVNSLRLNEFFISSFIELKILTHIMNLSLSFGIVPGQMKVARAIPLFKSGILTLFTNYRPISVLPAFSKFLERIVYKRLDSFLNKY